MVVACCISALVGHSYKRGEQDGGRGGSGSLHVQKEKGIRRSTEPATFTINYQLELGVAQTLGHDASALHTRRKHCCNVPLQGPQGTCVGKQLMHVQ